MLRELLLIALLVPGSDPNDLASLSGVVRDQAGTPLPGVMVTVTPVEPGESRTPITDDHGRYVARELAAGSYRLRAELPGFGIAIRDHVQVGSQERAVLNLILASTTTSPFSRTDLRELPSQGTRNAQFPPPPGQSRKTPFRFGGNLELGGRTFPDRPARSDRGKFEEYRDIPRGLFLEDLRFSLGSNEGTHVSEFRARRIGQRDQRFLVRSSTPGRYEFEFVWDQIPHVFSNTARTLYQETGRGVLVLDDAIQSAVQAAPNQTAIGALLSGFLAQAHDVDLAIRVDRAPVLFRLTPTPDWEIRADYTRTRKDGERPIGALTGYSNEVPEPIAQSAHDLRLTTELARQKWQLQFSYNPSLFRNDVDVVVWDSPLRLTDSTGSGPAQGRHDLAPDNTAHTASVLGAVNLPPHSRISGAFSYGLRFQNDALIPHTINTAHSNPALDLPAASLHGAVHTRLANIGFTTRPRRPISIAARYRLYEIDDRTPTLTFPGWVGTDFTLRTGTRGTVTSTRFSYTKQNAGVDLSWRLRTPLALKLGYDWERWDRDARVRAVPVSDEHSTKISLDYTPFDSWLTLRTSYAHARRRTSTYNTFAHLASTVTSVEFARLVPNGTSQSPLLRMYDQADRDRDRVDFLADVTLRDTLTFTPTVSFRNDDYPSSTFGLQHDRSWAAGIDSFWNPSERVALFASYTREQFRARQRSRYRPFLGDFTPRVDNDTYDWVGSNVDTVDTLAFGSDASPIPGKLDVNVIWNYSRAIGRMHAFNPVTPAGGTPAWDAAARASDLPDITDPFNQFDASLRYSFTRDWFARLRYVFERFNFSDFRTDNIQPYMGNVDPVAAPRAVYLGAQIRPYTAHILAFSIGYEF